MKPFLFSSICLSSIAFFAARSFDFGRLPIQKTVLKTEVLAVAAPLVSAPKMWSNGSAPLFKNETLELHFAAPNAPFLGVLYPSGHFFYLVFPKETASEKLQPLVDSDLFIDLKTLKIQPKTLRADPYQYGVLTNQPVFTKSGKYTFILGENLHVHDPTELEQLVIEYVHAERPTRATTEIAAF